MGQEAWWWYHTVGMFFSSRDWETSPYQAGGNERSKVQRSFMKTCSRVLRTSLGRRFTFQQDNESKHTAKTMQEWPRQSLHLNQIEHLWRDLKITVQQRSPFNLPALGRICREEWEKLPKYRCAKLVASYLRRLESVIAAKGASTK